MIAVAVMMISARIVASVIDFLVSMMFVLI